MSDLKVKFPKVFSFFENNEFAATTFLNKYALKDKEGNILEDDPHKTIDRVMTCLAVCMPTEFPSEEWIAKNNQGVVESWKDIFIKAAGNLNGVVPQGSVLNAIGNTDFLQSLSNCFVVDSPHDSIPGIVKTAGEAASITRRRGGVGIDLSTLRPHGAFVANAARTSTGVYGFMDFYSNVCRTMCQFGRRGALILTLDIKHPDAELFATAKQDLKYCTGANVSLKISDKFMKAVIAGKEFTQQYPIDSDSPLIKKKVNARDLWKTICKCAWTTGEPGLLFFDHVKKNLPADKYSLFKTHSVNPCAELTLSKNDSCRLAAICLPNYVENKFQPNCYFNYDKFVKDIRVGMRMMDALVSAEIRQIDLILQKAEREKQELQDSPEEDKKTLYDAEIALWTKIRNSGERGRRTGLGLYGLADCLAQLQLKYDADDSLGMIENIFKCFRDIAYSESVEMAKEYGPFPEFNWDTEKDSDFIKKLPSDVKEGIQKYGRRNISLLTCSPTGTLSILSQCSSGIEPTFRQMYLRRRKINPSDFNVKVDFVDDVGDKWSNHPQFERNVQLYFKLVGKELPEDVKNDEELMKYLPDYFTTSDKINWKRKIEILGVMSKYIDHSISNTLNIPQDTQPELIEEIYQMAWERGVRGVTVYRDGSRSGVLVSNETQVKEQEVITRLEAPKRPDKLPCDIYVTSTNKTEYVVIVGLLNNSVYEVFCGEYDNEIPKKPFSGFVEKRGKGKYILNYIHGVEIKQVDINSYFDNKEHATVTRLLSMALRHGTPLEYILQQLQRSSSNMFEFGPSLARVLKKYVKIEDMKKAYNKCASCGSTDVILTMEDGCFTLKCNACNLVDSKCG